MSQWTAPPSQHNPPDKQVIRADWLRLVTLGSLFVLGLLSTLSALWVLSLLVPFQVFTSLLSISILVSAVIVFLTARSWHMVLRKQWTDPKRLGSVIILCVLGLSGWGGFYYLWMLK